MHESCYRVYSILNLILEMVERGDSSVTIISTADTLMQIDLKKEIQDFETFVVEKGDRITKDHVFDILKEFKNDKRS